MRALDWAKTPLGAPEGWPESLKTLVMVMLGSKQPMFAAWGPERTMLYNDGYARLCRDRHPAALGAPFGETWRDIMDEVGPILERAFDGVATHMDDIRLVFLRDGRPQEAHFSFSYTPVRGAGGGVQGMFCACDETTEQVLAERRVREEQDRLAAVFESAPGYVAVLRGPDLIVESVNAAHRRDFDSADWPGRPIRECVPSLEGQGYFELLDQVYATGERLAMTGALANLSDHPGASRAPDQFYDLVFAPLTNAAGEITGVYTECFDVTDRYRLEEARDTTRRELERLTDALPVLIAYVDRDLVYRFANRTYETWFPLRRADLIGRSVIEVIGEEAFALVKPHFDAALAGDRVTYDERTPYREGFRDVRVEFVPRWDDDGAVLGFYALVRDVTDQVRAETALRESESRLRVLDELGRATAISTDADEILAVTTRLVGEHLGASVCAYADMDKDQDGFTIRGDWAAPGEAHIVGRYRLADFGAAAVERLSAGLPLVLGDIPSQVDPHGVAAFGAIGVRATLCMPLVKEGRLTAMMAVHDSKPRLWSEQDKALMLEVTERSWAHVERVRAEAVLRDSEARLRFALDAGRLGQASYDMRTGALEHTPALARLFGYDEDARLTVDDLRARYHPDDVEKVARTRERNLAAGHDLFELDHRIVTPTGEERWLFARASVERGPDGTVERVTAFYLDETDRRAAEAAYLEKARELETVLDAVPAAIWTTRDEDAAHIEGNAFSRRLLRLEGGNMSLTAPEGERPSGFRVLDAEGRELAPEDLPVQRAARGEEVFDFEEQIVFDDGGSIHLAGNARPLRDERGDRRGAVAAFVDITARKQVEQALRASEAQFRALADAMPQLVWTADPDGRVDYYNERSTEYAGLSRSADGGFDWAPVVHPDEMERTVAAWGKATQTGSLYTCEHRLKRADGSWAWHVSRGVPRRDAAGAIVKWYGTATDVHALKAAQEATEALNAGLERRVQEAVAEKRLLADLVENTDAFVQVADQDLNWLAVNRAAADEFERVFGVRPRVGDNMRAVLADRPEQRAAVEAMWTRALASEAFTAIDELGDPALDRRHYEMRFSPLFDAGGRRIGTYQFAYDVTERLRDQARLAQVEEALRQGQKMQAVGQLAGGIAHDFNNLLGAIVGSLDLVRRRSQIDDRTRRFVDNAFTAAERGAKLTGQLLAFARAQKLELKPLIVSDLVGGMEELLTRTLGPQVRLELKPAEGAAPVLSDATQLEMAVLNLAINARDAMPDGGALTLTTRLVTLTDDPELAPGDYVELAVADTGQGMPPEVVARAFDPFFTTKGVGQGTGLGLSQVYGIAQQAGGTARIDSRPGQGTTVRLFLRRTELPVMDGVLDVEVGAGPAARTARVLVVDDDPELRRFLTDSLDALGYAVDEAADGLEGLRRIEAHAPDLLILDYAMPGMTGAEVARQVRADRPDLPILFASGYADTAAIEAVMGADARVLRKPFRLHELQAMLADALG